MQTGIASNAKLISYLMIRICFFGVPINTREVFGVLHVKGFVFDDTVLYSGASINNVYLHQFEKYRYGPLSKNHSCRIS
ncbi:phosphatidylserine synthase [Haemophilus influenzae]|uniref:Phosphatidylserine synthase n=1 Tax=Haemophilus influenzae TaxID=727 RepID=A0A2X1PJC3_HAEIF|nr:phosphatidylserine synthase [Haemophilus influenzae]